MHDLTPFEEFWQYSNRAEPYPSADCNDKKANPQTIPHSLFLNQKQFEKVSTKNKTLFKMIWVKEILKMRNLSDEELCLATQLCADSINIIQTKNTSGKTVWFEGYAKGTERYNKISQGKIYDFVEYYKGLGYESYFLTLTCDIKKYGNRTEAWENFLKDEFYPVMENLRKHHKCKYVATMESTTRGYPHAHIIMFFPKGTYPELSKLKNKKKIHYGRLYNYVKESVASPVFCLEKAEGDNLKFYLAKYIGKGIEEDVFKIAKQKEKLTKAQRKLLQEFIYLKVFQKRKVLMSRIEKITIKNERSELEQVGVSAQSQGKEEISAATSLRQVLTSLCINSPFSSQKTVYSMSFNQFSISFSAPAHRNNDVDAESQEIFEKNGTLLYDNSNFILDLIDFILGNWNNRINRKFYWNYSENIYSRFLDGYDLNDDEDFMNAVAALWKFYCTEIIINGNSYYNVLHGFENLSSIRIDEKENENYYRFVDKQDYRNRFYYRDELKKMYHLA